MGDILAKYHWIVTDAEPKQLSERFYDRAFEPVIIDASKNIVGLFEILQSMPDKAELKLFFQRDGKTREANLAVHFAEDWFGSRELGLLALKQIHQTDSIATAASLGLRETKRRFVEVLNFLRLLVTGRVGAKGLGGPIMIAQAASSEASGGVSRLLIFLTLLSANLAILNFLPIPALDGGHMMFLTAEAIRGKPVSEALQIRLTMVGVLGLLSLMAFVIVNDIMRLL
ncbi:MAG: site-2 protease family protein [Pirellulaceae bacterium]